MPYIEIEVQQGILRGLTVDGVSRFLGVPYGASTAGDRRFRPPAPPPSWEGIRDALQFGPAAPQVDARGDTDGVAARIEELMHPHGGSARSGGPMSEDCLTVNIWSPSTPPDALRPVIVWLHGGGFTSGSGSETWYDGEALARAEGVIVVTVTHRLGVLGFLDLRAPEVGGVSGSVNAGMLDLVAALRWVRDEIERFGGDPGRVTIAGQSGGGGKVAALTAMPAARGLFQRTVIQSGPIRRFLSEPDARSFRDRVLTATGTDGVEALRALPVEQLLEAQRTVLKDEGEAGVAAIAVDAVPGLGPSLDPNDLPGDAYETDDESAVPTLIGFTDHEVSLFLAGTPFFTSTMTGEQAAATLDGLAPGAGAETYAALAAAFPDEPPHQRLARAFTAYTFGPAIATIAESVARTGGPVWVYEFGRRTEVHDELLGACHALDIPYVFGTYDRIPFAGRSPGQAELAAEMMHAWATFAQTGAPEASRPWPAWTSDGRSTYRFGDEQGAS